MQNSMKKPSILKLFGRKKGRLDDRIKRDYVRNGVATIPCHVSDYSDVISPYSVEGFETINMDFFDYIKRTAEFLPPECPVVLNIIGDCLTEKQQETIRTVMREDSAYNLGAAEREEKKHMRVFLGMIIGLLISGILLWMSKSLEEEPRELFFILFWFMGDTLCDYIFVTGDNLRDERILAARLASIQVVFSDTFTRPEYTKEDVDKLYSAIEKDVSRTIQKS